MTLVERLRALAETVPPGGSVTIPRDWLAAELETADRVVSIAPNGNGNGPTERPDRLLGVGEAAGRLGVTPRWLYRHADDFPFTVRLPGRQLRFREAALTAWLARRRP